MLAGGSTATLATANDSALPVDHLFQQFDVFIVDVHGSWSLTIDENRVLLACTTTDARTFSSTTTVAHWTRRHITSLKRGEWSNRAENELLMAQWSQSCLCAVAVDGLWFVCLPSTRQGQNEGREYGRCWRPWQGEMNSEAPVFRDIPPTFSIDLPFHFRSSFAIICRTFSGKLLAMFRGLGKADLHPG